MTTDALDALRAGYYRQQEEILMELQDIHDELDRRLMADRVSQEVASLSPAAIDAIIKAATATADADRGD